ncbi:response regulator receiver protein [Thioalkalivibrio sp. K90mix]|jgi:CheY-like chemotaxis protein|uniref:response regulator n=1 Tax=unclassified Thioalkalivibrio TaxID=2621013 RepID=UPI000195AADC|nr:MULTISPECIES: response regulator [unclassified Thioalkalivibrio]ADC71194.1 response regulator receiver protein [Thioalkalivibrio sp. K90mix]
MSPNARQPAILVVEDNPVDIDLMQRAFDRRNLANPLEIARDGEEALACLQRWESGEQEPPAVILLDIKLPKISGLEVLRAVRAHPEFGRIPVVMLTSSSEDRDIHTAYDAGANSYIVKPVDFTKFMEVAEHVELYWCLLNQHPR